MAIGLIAMILLNFSLAVSRLSDQNKVLAQRLGLLQQRIEEADAARGAIGAEQDVGETKLQQAEPVAAEKLSSRR